MVLGKKTGSITSSQQFQDVAKPITMPNASKAGQQFIPADNTSYAIPGLPALNPNNLGVMPVGQQLQTIQQNQQPLGAPAYNPSSFAFTPTKDYTQQASDEIQPLVNTQLQLLQNALKNKLTNLEGQKSGINQQAEDSVLGAQRNTKMQQNAYQNNSLGRGIGRSTIATTGEASYGIEENRILANIDKIKNNALSNIDAEKVNQQNQYQDTATGINADTQAKIRSRAEELKNIDYDRAFKEKAYADEQAYKNAQLKYQQDNADYEKEFNQKKFDASRDDEAFNRKLEASKLELARISASNSGSKDKNEYVIINGVKLPAITSAANLQKKQIITNIMSDDGEGSKVVDNGITRNLFPIEKVRIFENELKNMSVYQGGEWDTLKAAYQSAINSLYKKMQDDTNEAMYGK